MQNVIKTWQKAHMWDTTYKNWKLNDDLPNFCVDVHTVPVQSQEHSYYPGRLMYIIKSLCTTKKQY